MTSLSRHAITEIHNHPSHDIGGGREILLDLTRYKLNIHMNPYEKAIFNSLFEFNGKPTRQPQSDRQASKWRGERYNSSSSSTENRAEATTA